MKFETVNLSTHFGDVEYQKKISDSIESKIEEARKHIISMHMTEACGVDVFSNCFLPKTHPDFEPPSKAIVSCVVDLIVSRGYSKTDISKELGITTDRNRTLNYWISDSRDTQIPYSAWLHMCSLAGLMLPLMLTDKNNN
ncbi:conserved hypothetical protein [Vibrio chagasii]|nr:conserved hypothetical protein [Vibrio chagasii]